MCIDYFPLNTCPENIICETGTPYGKLGLMVESLRLEVANKSFKMVIRNIRTVKIIEIP